MLSPNVADMQNTLALMLARQANQFVLHNVLIKRSHKRTVLNRPQAALMIGWLSVQEVQYQWENQRGTMGVKIRGEQWKGLRKYPISCGGGPTMSKENLK